MLWTTRWCFFAASLFTSQLFAATDSVKLNVKATVETEPVPPAWWMTMISLFLLLHLGMLTFLKLMPKQKLKYLSYSLRIVLVFLIKSTRKIN